EDFLRMQRRDIMGYGKPVMRLENDVLVINSVPVPKRSFYAPLLTQKIKVIGKLKCVELLEKIAGGTSSAEMPSSAGTHGQTPEVLTKILEDLQRMNERQHSELVLVYLPVKSDCGDEYSQFWRQLVRVESAKKKLIFVDLIDDFRRLDCHEV